MDVLKLILAISGDDIVPNISVSRDAGYSIITPDIVSYLILVMTLSPIFPDIPDMVYLVMTLSPIFQSPEMPDIVLLHRT